MARHPAGATAITQHDLRERVVAWKRQFFGSIWANYDLAKPGTFRLVPNAIASGGAAAMTDQQENNRRPSMPRIIARNTTDAEP